MGDVWETFGRRLGPHRWPELETTARPGEESSGGGGSGWGSRRCGSGQPAVPAGGISPTESSWCQRAPGPEVVPLHSYPRRGLTGISDSVARESSVDSLRWICLIMLQAIGASLFGNVWLRNVCLPIWSFIPFMLI